MASGIATGVDLSTLRFQGMTESVAPMCSTLVQTWPGFTAFRSGPSQVQKRAGSKHAYPSSRRVPTGYSSTGCSPALPVSASPAHAI
jgi:hypothetical protein